MFGVRVRKEILLTDGCIEYWGRVKTLTEVAEALVSNVDAPLRAYAATIPVNQR